MIRLNVGGKKFTTSIATLSREPDSMLAKLVNEQWLENGETSSQNELFVDRHTYKC